MAKLKKIYLGIIIVFLYAPILVLIAQSFNASRYRGQWTGFTLQWYEKLFTSEDIIEAFLNTLTIGLTAAFFATLLGLITALAIRNLSKKSQLVFRGLANVPLLNADIVTGISLMLLFLGLGLGSILFFTLCYFTAISIMPLSTAAILLYTSPIWVTLLSALLFHERLTPLRLLALALAFGGCVLVSGPGGELSLRGLLIGLGAGLGYGLYSILGTIALRRYSPLTVTAWTFLIAGLGSAFLRSPLGVWAKLQALPAETPVWSLLLFFALMALVTAVIPFLSYTLGLRTVAPGRAAILATVEPLVATLFGALVFHEPLTLLSALGIALILSAVVLLNGKKE